MDSTSRGFAIAICIFALFGCSRAKSPGSARRGPPNVVVITVDTLRADRLGCYGFAGARTPHIDRLASEGVRVARASVSSPITLPSHTSIFTGLEPPAHGVRNNGTYRVPDQLETLAERFKRSGYRTHAVVSAEVLNHRFNLSQGFDEYDDALWTESRGSGVVYRERPAERTIDRALQVLSALPAFQSQERIPLFLWVHLFDPHWPYSPPQEDAKLAETPYDGEIAYVDRQIGRLVKALEDAKILDNTIFVLTSDHGESLGEHGEATHAIFIYESTIRVPLIVRYPRELPTGKVYEHPVRSVDLMPTILALAGIETHATQGVDLSSALAGESLAPRLAEYSESQYLQLAFGMAPLHGLRLDDWTYIRAPRKELYNRANDPGELRNLLILPANDPGQSKAIEARAADLEAKLRTLLEQSKRTGAEAAAAALDPQTKQMLEALGYVGDAERPSTLRGMDPKDGIRVHARIDRALQRVHAGDDRGAISRLKPLLDEHPDLVPPRNAIAGAELRLGNIEEAARHYEKSLANDPAQPEVLVQLAKIDLRTGNTELARQRLTGAIELAPDSTDAMILLGQLELRSGDRHNAKRWYERAIEAEPSRPDAYMLLGETYFRDRDFEAAKRAYERGLDVSPGNFVGLLQVGICELQLRDAKTAEDYFWRAAKLEPRSWRPAYNLACARVQQGDLDSAVAYLREAADRGFSNSAQLRSDRCLLPLHERPDFLALSRALRRP